VANAGIHSGSRSRSRHHCNLVAISVYLPAKKPHGTGDYLGPGHSVLSFIASRSSFLIGELLLGKLSEAVVFGHLVTRSSFVTTATALLAITASSRKNPGSATLSGSEIKKLNFGGKQKYAAAKALANEVRTPTVLP
jgi:hypothetical protein